MTKLIATIELEFTGEMDLEELKAFFSILEESASQCDVELELIECGDDSGLYSYTLSDDWIDYDKD